MPAPTLIYGPSFPDRCRAALDRTDHAGTQCPDTVLVLEENARRENGWIRHWQSVMGDPR